jgi:hypothetical protein
MLWQQGKRLDLPQWQRKFLLNAQFPELTAEFFFPDPDDFF